MGTPIAIVGGGHVGSALQKAFAAAGRDARIAPRETDGLRRAVSASPIVILAIPFPARQEVVATLGPALAGKIVVDVTNPVKFPGPTFDREGSESGAEELQRWAPDARVVKAFNTVFYPFMTDPVLHGERLSAFVASDDEGARREVLALASAAGFDAVDAGPLVNARGLEQLLYLEMMLEKVHGSRIGVRLVRG